MPGCKECFWYISMEVQNFFTTNKSSRYLQLITLFRLLSTYITDPKDREDYIIGYIIKGLWRDETTMFVLFGKLDNNDYGIESRKC